MSSSTLQFGILIQSPILKKWQVECIQRLIADGHRLSLVITAEYEANQVPKPLSKYKRFLGKNGLYNLYQRFLHRVPLIENTDATTFLSAYPDMQVRVTRTGRYTDRIAPADCERIKENKLDFILRFGLNIIRGEMLNTARLGIWSLHHDDEQVIRGGPPGFWEIAKGHKQNGILLQRLTEKLDNGITLRKAFVPVIKHSYKAHHNELLRYGVDLIRFAAREFAVRGTETAPASEEAAGKMYYAPRNMVMLAFFIIQLKNKIAFHFDDLFRQENWNIGISKMSVKELFEQQKLNPVTWHPKPDRSSFFADGFLYRNPEDKLQVLYENFDYKRFKARIDSCEYTEEGGFTKSRPLLETKVHLSFPYPVKDDERGLFIPEAHASQSLDAYFLQKPENKLPIMPEGAIDAVIFKHQQKWWMFCTFKENGSNIHLFAFHAPSVEGEWCAHPGNPIVSDASRARMAGEMIRYNNSLYRPAQINHLNYGGGIRLMEVLQLNEESYEEREAFVLTAEALTPYDKGTHTLSLQDGYILTDAKNNKFVPSVFVQKLRQKF